MSDRVVSEQNLNQAVRRLGVLHALIAAAGALGLCYYRPSVDAVESLFGGLLLGQTSLLAVWGGLAPKLSWKRCFGVIAGVLYIAALMEVCLCSRSFVPFVIFAAVASFVSASLVVLRSFGVAFPGVSRCKVNLRSRFTLRQLMQSIFAIACVCAVGRLILHLPPRYAVTLDVFIVAFAFGVVGVLPAWPMLVSKRPVPLGMCAVAVASLMGYFLAQVFAEREVYWIVTTTVAATTEALTLGLVRLFARGIQKTRNSSY